MVAFGGWDMPLEYTGITQEHLAVRQSAGLFDVSHMGELEVAGKDALAAMQALCSNDAAKLQPGHAQYSALLTEQGTFVDDLVVYRLRSDHFLLVVNAANIVKDYTWIAERIAADFASRDAVVMDASSRYALLSVQGPKASRVVQPLTGVDLSSMSLPYRRRPASRRSVSRAPRPHGTSAPGSDASSACHTRSACCGGTKISKPSSPVYPVREIVARTLATSPCANV